MKIIVLNEDNKIEELKIIDDLTDQCGRKVYPSETGDYIVGDYGDGSLAVEWYDEETEEWLNRRELKTRLSVFDRVMLEGETSSRPVDEVAASRFLRAKRVSYICQEGEES